nr:hypothetical protein G6P99_34465 [Bradyrhizobium sp. 6(2017)]
MLGVRAIRRACDFLKETIMHAIIESLSPEHGHIDWKWVGSVFAFYIVLTIGGVGLLLAH